MLLQACKHMTDSITRRKPKLVLHIGHDKCGSTSIQETLNSNSGWYKKRGVMVVNSTMPANETSEDRKGVIWVMDEIYRHSEEGNFDLAADKLACLVDTIREVSKRYPLLVLSSENLYRHHHAALWGKYQNEFEIQIVYYIRRQDEWLLSAWKQWGLKSGINLISYVEQQTRRGHPDFNHTAKIWESEFGYENCHIRPLHSSALHEGDLIKDFFEATGIPVPPKILENFNITPDYSFLHLFEKNPQLFSDAHDTRISNFLHKYPEITQPRDKIELLGREGRKHIMEVYEAGNLELWQRYFSNVPYDTIFGTDLYPEPAQRPSDVEVLLRVCAMQLEILKNQHEAIWRLEKQVKPLILLRKISDRFKRKK
jgi:hypothetical protein